MYACMYVYECIWIFSTCLYTYIYDAADECSDHAKKTQLALTRPPPPQCRLLPSANPAWLSRRKNQRSKSVHPQTRASSFHCTHTNTRNDTTRARVATCRETNCANILIHMKTNICEMKTNILTIGILA